MRISLKLAYFALIVLQLRMTCDAHGKLMGYSRNRANPERDAMQMVDKLYKTVSSITLDDTLSLMNKILSTKQYKANQPPEYWLLRQGRHISTKNKNKNNNLKE